MAKESINILVQCEKESRDLINNAKKERISLKQRAKVDAQEIIESIKKQCDDDLKECVVKGEAQIQEEEDRIVNEFNEKVTSLENVLIGKESLMELVVEKICTSAKMK